MIFGGARQMKQASLRSLAQKVTKSQNPIFHSAKQHHPCHAITRPFQLRYIIAFLLIVLLLGLYPLESACGLSGSLTRPLKWNRTVPCTYHRRMTRWRTLYHPFASRARNGYRRSVSGVGDCRRSLCCRVLSCVVAYRSELFLPLAPHIAFVQQVVTYLLWLSAESIAQ